MSNLDTAKKFMEIVEQNNVDELRNMVSANFTFAGPTPEPLNTEQYVEFLQGNMKAFSEFKYNASNFTQEGDTCSCNIKITGKHTGELAMPGMDSIPATNKTFELPTESVVATFDGDKISRIEAKVHADGGIQGIIKQITS